MYNNIQDYFSSEINPLQSSIEYFKSTQEYIDLVALFTVIYRVVCNPDIFYKKFMIFNSQFGIIGELLNNLKKSILLISDHYEELYFTPFEYRDRFKIVNWKIGSPIRLFFNPDLLFDFNFDINNINLLSKLFDFLNYNNNPLLVLLNVSNISNDQIISIFENNRYNFDLKKKNKIIELLNNKISKYNINNLLIFNYNTPVIVKEDIGLCQEL